MSLHLNEQYHDGENYLLVCTIKSDVDCRILIDVPKVQARGYDEFFWLETCAEQNVLSILKKSIVE